MRKIENFRAFTFADRARSNAGIRAAIVLGLIVLVPVCQVRAQTPRAGSAAWFGSFNAPRGVTPSTTSGGTGSASNVAPGNSVGTGVARSIANFAQAARAIAQAQAAQSQAAQNRAASSVPNGLTPGGLWVAPAAIAANPASWSGAAPPVAAASAPRAGASGAGTIVTVNQTAKTADLTWTNFNVGANTTLQFNQGGSDWTVLNRVNDPGLSPSQILGAISAPGQVLILNPNGILFGAGAQVNVGALVASTANLATAQFNGILSTQTSSGTYLPAFVGATTPVTVLAGASITTNAPASAADRGGSVLLLGQSVVNAGQITTANGQAVLAAGQNFVIRPGYSADNNPTSTTLGLEVASTGSGSVANSGLIEASTGDITLTGETVSQAGVLLSSTTVGQRGTIHLLTNTADTASSITFAPGSLTAIEPEDDGTTATNTARANLISQSATDNDLRASASLLSNQAALPDQQYQSRIEIVSGGSVEFQNGSLNLSTGGQIAVYGVGRVLTDAGATLSVAGSVDTSLPASANTLQITVQGYDLRDAPANRDTGALTSQSMNIAIGQLTQIANPNDAGAPYLYTSGGLLEVSGYVAGVGHSIGEWTSLGGTIALTAAEVVAQPGAVFNVSGGLVTYAAGNTANTWLTTSGGQLYNVNTAPANVTYTGVYNGFTVSQPRWGITDTFTSPLVAPASTYNPAYTVGRDAGTLTINAPTTIMEATIAAGVSVGEFQGAARPSGVTDPFTLGQTVVPLSGDLVIGPALLGNIPPTIATTGVSITANGQTLASSLGVTTPIPADRIDTTWLAAALLNNAALGGLTVVTQGAIQVDAPLSLADGGAVALLAPNVELSAAITARGGQVAIGNYSPVWFTASSTRFLDGSSAGGSPLPASVVATSSGLIDTRGVFTNLSFDPTAVAGEAFVNGGPVTIDTSGAVTLAAGSMIDASAGGAVLANHSVKGGVGGAISITAYDPNDLNAAAPSVPVAIAATLRAFGSGAAFCTSCLGGALTLNVPGVVISNGATPAASDPADLTLTPGFFTSGFSAYSITGQNGLSVANGTLIVAVQPVEQFTAATALVPSGTDPAAAFSLVLPALYTPNIATATIVQRPGVSVTLRGGTPASATGGITIGTAAGIAVDPSQTISLEAQGTAAVAGTEGQITVDGTLSAPSGTISIVNDQYQGTSDSLSIWLGATSVLDVSARAITALDSSGRAFGTVGSGGTIRIGGQSGVDSQGYAKSTNAFVVVEPGAVLRAAGASALLDPTAGKALSTSATGRSAQSQAILVAGNGGSISFDSESGIYLGGQISAPAGGAGAQGGALSVNLVTPDYTDPSRFNQGVVNLPIYQAPRELVIGTVEPSSSGAARPGSAFPTGAFGQAPISASAIAAGGFDVVNLSSGDAILFDGAATLTAGRSITLSTAILGETGTAGTASVNAPYVTLAGSGTATRSGLTFQRTTLGEGANGQSPEWQPSTQGTQATLAVNAANIDISGNLYVGVSAPIIAKASGNAPLCVAAACPIADLAGFASVALSSAGDIRLLPGAGPYTTLTTPGDLALVAGQVYPVAGVAAYLTAGFSYDTANQVASYLGSLTIGAAPGPVPAAPLTAGGQLTLRAGTIEQGGVLRAPDGQITLGALGANDQVAPNLTQDAFGSRVTLLPGSITSVSMNGLTIPYGGTSDGTTYFLNGVAVTGSSLLPPQIAVNAQSIQVSAGATIDVSGGGVLAGAGFVPGRGGSTDILQTPLLAVTAAGTVTQPSAATNLVAAIVPGFADTVAPPTATATAFTGTLPAAGDQITIGAGIPGLPAGTYTLLPGSDALLPGAWRVELATTVHTVLPNATSLGNGSYLINGYRGVANTDIRASQPIVVTVTPGAAVRLDAQYDETSYAAFALSQAALFGQPRASLTLPADTKSLAFGFPATAPASGLALQIDGNVLSAPGPGGLGGIIQVAAGAPIEVIGNAAAATPGMVSVLASDLSGLNANTLIVGGGVALNTQNGEEQFASATPSVTVRDGATLSASQVFVVAAGGITIERGATISTIGAGMPSLDSSSGLTFNNNNLSVLAVSNGALSFQPATLGGPIAIGGCSAPCGGPATLLSQGTIATVTTGAVSLDSSTLLGASALDLSASVFNLGTPPTGTAGLTLTADTVRALLTGDAAAGVPGLLDLTLTASNSVNFYGAFSLDAGDPITGQGTLRSLEINSPAIYGAPGVNASLTAGTFIWNGILTADGSASLAPGIWARGGGTANSALAINANTIVLGYGPADQAQNQVSLDRLIAGFDSVGLTASQSIGGNSKGSLSVYQTVTQDSAGNVLTSAGGDLTLTTPVLTGAPGSVFSMTAGGNLTISGAGSVAGAVSAQGASLTLNATNISANSSIVMPSGQLVMNAQGAIGLGSQSRLDLAGVTTTLFDQSTSGWGGTVTLQAATGGITQDAGGTIDVSAGNANAGTVTAVAAGPVNLAGAVIGGAASGFTGGSFTVRASLLGGGDANSGFAALNASLDAGGFFGGRSFELLTGDLTIGAGTSVTANTVSVSVDAGSLTVAGTVNASGSAPGTIRLAAGNGLTISAGAVLDAHATVAQVDSYGQSIDAENTASVTLSTVNGMIGIAPASATLPAPVINVAAASGVTCAGEGGQGACGQVVLNAPRLGGNGAGDIGLTVPVGVSIQGAGSIAVNAFQTYSATSTITQSWFTRTPAADATAFMTAAVSPAGALNAVLTTKLAGLMAPALATEFHLRPGVEIDSPTPAGGLTIAGDLDLSQFRFQSVGGSSGITEPGALVIRAGGVLTVNGSINDGFTGAPSLRALVPSTSDPLNPAAATTVTRAFWELAQPLAPNSDGTLAQSWSIQLVGGADLAAADSRTVVPSDALTAAAAIPATGSIIPANTTVTPGSIVLYDAHSQPINPGVPNAATFQLPGWSVIRTGTGDLDLLAGGSVDELSTYAIYTAGASSSLPAGSRFNLPRGTVSTTPQVTFSGQSGTQIKAGTLVSDGTTQFATASTITLRGSAVTVAVQPVSPGSVYNDPVGTTLTLVNPIAGVTSATAAVVLSSDGSVLGSYGQATNNGITLESLVATYQAWYPRGGGNVLISAGGDITGFLATPTLEATGTDGVQPMDGVGDFLWRQAGNASGAGTAWWINFGTMALPLNANGENAQVALSAASVPTLTGFTGIGTLGGGNVSLLAGGNIGTANPVSAPSGTQYSVSQAIDVAIASTGRVSADGSGIAQTGGGALNIRAGGALNGGGTASGNNQANGTLTDTRGAIDVLAQSIGQITLGLYGKANDNGSGEGDPRAASSLSVSQAQGQGGPIVVLGDATASLDARGDLVLAGAGDPTRLTEQNLTPAGGTSGGAASGLAWFSLWQPTTAIHLDSAGGNLEVSTQAVVAATGGQQQNAIATDDRFLYPPTLSAVAASGSIYSGTETTSNVSGAPSSIELAPAPRGQLELLAAGSIFGDSVAGGQPQSFDISGASVSALPSPSNPAYGTLTASGSLGVSNLTADIGAGPLSLFSFGADTASGTLHAGDPAPALIYAGGDIVDFRYGETLCFAAACTNRTPVISPTTWYVSGKAVRMIAGNDIVEPGTLAGQTNPPSTISYTSTSGLIVNNNADDVSEIEAGGEIIYANATVAGPGQLYVQAGGTVYQADKSVLESLGPLTNGALSAGPSRTGGAGITVLAGASTAEPDWQAFAQTYLAPAMGYDADLLAYLRATYGYDGDISGAPAFFKALPVEQQRAFLLMIYFDELRASGREFTDPTSARFKSYLRGKTAIATLFPAASGGGSESGGDITLFGNSGIRTDFGGTVALLSPAGATTLGVATGPQPGASAGVLTQGTGDVDIFSQGSVILGQSRVFTTFGGSIVIWSAAGDINAGNGIKSTQLFSAALIEYDAFGGITLAPSIPTSGAGIATLAPIPGTPEGDVDLIAPLGVIDAGEAGIRVSGNANLAALTVVNAANVQVGGKSAGLTTVSAPNVSVLSAANATAAAAAQSAQAASGTAGPQTNQGTPSTITVELLGFGDL